MPKPTIIQRVTGSNKHRQTELWRDAFSLIAGLLFTLAFAPFEYAFLAPIALILLFASWLHTSPFRALLRGYLFGLGSFGSGVSWVFVSIHDYGHADAFSAGALTSLFVAFWALFPALAGWLAVMTRSTKSVLGLPLLWILIEYFRGVLLLNGFPWLLGAYSQLHTPLAGYIPLVGAYGTGFLLALSTTLIVAMLHQSQQRRWQGGVLLMIWLVGGLLQTIDWTHPIGKPLSVALIQGNIPQDQKWLPENQLKTMMLYKDLTARHWGTDIIVWPESAIPAYLSEVEGFYLAPLQTEAEQQHSDVIVSLPVEGKGENEMYNSVLTLGRHRGIFSKNHLLPFGEYMPWQPLSGYILSKLDIRLGDFTPGGDTQALLQAGGYPFITSICYEDAFGDANIVGLPQAAYLVNVTNDGWFGNSIEPHQHLQIAQMRAIETGRFMLRATNTGVTAVIAPDGNVVAKAEPFTTTVLASSITPMGGMTPYAKIGDLPVVLALLIGFLAWLVYSRVGFKPT
ncbi:MAG: apolipoprotein N-acyltransferase [Methylovulum sp.]|uniref:apolipoprotein N-acyltransferase n=1 Tax=Methylovulum sp. TaxID=1916980 RepID=UPI0026074B10|nr:apolipoprotein N-acyltransferase [Methylovulum sp.]MDD2725474.1 apolipoprotein N-acyltransferase [Methylovulum sp.]MDD5126218.1 apolipoprotein N-acyltransferase [Methylovulum sp.]